MEAKSTIGWKIAFAISLVCATVFLLMLVVVQQNAKSQISTLNSNYASLNSKYNALTSSNAQAQATCIANAQSLAATMPTLPNTGPNETAAISACEAQNPTN